MEVRTTSCQDGVKTACLALASEPCPVVGCHKAECWVSTPSRWLCASYGVYALILWFTHHAGFTHHILVVHSPREVHAASSMWSTHHVGFTPHIRLHTYFFMVLTPCRVIHPLFVVYTHPVTAAHSPSGPCIHLRGLHTASGLHTQLRVLHTAYTWV
ncbi:hypothetical protein BJ165DRAFT_1447832, partial [Panaeolus papilionaceus]